MLDVQALHVILVVVISYLLGSFPTAYLVARQKGVNVFNVGSGNMGATNVIRAVGFWWGILVWFFDSVKGILAILIARQIMVENVAGATAIAAIVSVIGHNWSLAAALVTGTLRGGKGAACAFGTMIMIAPFQAIVAMLALGAAVIALTRYVSLAVLCMFTLATLWLVVLVNQGATPHEYLFYSLLLSALILYRFRENIQRLLSGTERRLGDPA
jgi:glycerol-3-phosphate acyltransferase PlsY